MSDPTPEVAHRYCSRDLVVEQVVTTTYKLVCPVHGTYAVGLSAPEAAGIVKCAMPHSDDPDGDDPTKGLPTRKDRT